jgi:hypothetical protein
MAAAPDKFMVLQPRRKARGLPWRMRHRVEHVLDAWSLSGMPTSVAMDEVPAL